MGCDGPQLFQSRRDRQVKDQVILRAYPTHADASSGSISFQYPTKTIDAQSTAPELTAVIAETIQPFLVDPEVTHATFSVGGVDVGSWDNGTAYLLLVANLDEEQVYVSWSDVGLGEMINATAQVRSVFSVGQTMNATGLNVGPGGIGVYTSTPLLE